MMQNEREKNAKFEMTDDYEVALLSSRRLWSRVETRTLKGGERADDFSPVNLMPYMSKTNGDKLMPESRTSRYVCCLTRITH